MEDILLYHIRYTKKEIEREIKLIFLKLKKTFNESKAWFNKTILYIYNHNTSNVSFENFQNFNNYQNIYLLGQYFIEKGYLETFFSFQRENNIIIYEYNFYAEKKLLINYINEEKSKKVLEWIKFYKKKITQNNPNTILNLLCNLFYIYKNDHLSEENCDVNCINFIRKYLSNFTSINKEQITKLIMSLITKKTPIQKSPTDIQKENSKLMSEIKTIIVEKYKEFFGLGIFSLFELLVVLGITSLKTGSCEKKENKNELCPICRGEGYNLATNKIFNYVHNRSYLFCSLTGKVTTSANQPMVNPDGKIVCKECINKYKINDDKYRDPKTKKEYKINDCKLLYLS